MKTKKKKGIARLIELSGEKRTFMVLCIIFSALGALLQMIPFVSVYYIMAELLQHVSNVSGLNGPFLIMWALRGIIGLLIGYVFMYIGGMSGHIAAYRIICAMRLKLAEHIGELPMGFFNNNSIGKIKQIMETDLEQIEGVIAHQLPDMINTVMILVAMFIIMFSLNVWLALASVIPIVIGLACEFFMLFKNIGKVGLKENYDALEDINASSIQYIRGMPSIKIFGQTVYSFRKFYSDIIKYRDFIVQMSNRIRPGFVRFRMFIMSVATFIIPIGLFFFTRNPNDISFSITLIFFLVIAPGVTTPIFKLANFTEITNTVSEGVDRIERVLNESIVEEPRTGKKPSSFDIEFHDVSFKYYEGKEALKKIDFIAKQGQITALVGPSGSGKSTIAQLIPRFWDIQKGYITIGGIDIRNINTSNLMLTMSFVFQDSFIFSDTIYNNILMGKPDASREEIYAASSAAQCNEFIERLPKGYDTLIGEGGVYLSGGEEQRISVARAILKNAPILIMDEATAYADPGNEYQMQLALQELIKGKTVLIIAHRLTTICNANQIFVVDDGQIKERGTHEELLAFGGLYRAMWDTYIGSTVWKVGEDKRKEDVGL